MRKATFDYLCKQLCRYIIRKQDTILRKCIPVELRLSVTLWFLSTGTDYRTLAHLFGISKASVCHIIKEVCGAIVNVLMKQYIKIPTGDMEIVVNGFEEACGFPNCGGAIDGCHIPIMSPASYRSDYYNSIQ